jgi:N6-adenosine-specific RNA methylase IME4
MAPPLEAVIRSIAIGCHVAKRSSDEGVAFWWVKLNKGGEGYFTGLGYWTRASLELCLLATDGSNRQFTRPTIL